jgi:hypothetical protein
MQVTLTRPTNLRNTRDSLHMRVVTVFWKVTKKTNIRVTTTNVRNVGGVGSRDNSGSRQQTRQTSIVNKIISIGEKVIDTIDSKRGKFVEDRLWCSWNSREYLVVIRVVNFVVCRIKRRHRLLLEARRGRCCSCSRLLEPTKE